MSELTSGIHFSYGRGVRVCSVVLVVIGGRGVGGSYFPSIGEMEAGRRDRGAALTRLPTRRTELFGP